MTFPLSLSLSCLPSQCPCLLFFSPTVYLSVVFFAVPYILFLISEQFDVKQLDSLKINLKKKTFLRSGKVLSKFSNGDNKFELSVGEAASSKQFAHVRYLGGSLHTGLLSLRFLPPRIV